MKYTKEQKNEYFKKLRGDWRESKKLADENELAKALYRESGSGVSYTSFHSVLRQMQVLGLEGVPYVDCKTFRKWKDTGYVVQKGERSKLTGITWLEAIKREDKKDSEKGKKNKFMFPKKYKLFHKSQVERMES